MSGRVFHAPLLHVHAGFRIRKIWERSPKGAQDRYPEVEVCRTLGEILEDEQTELVIVNTPEPTHYDCCVKALEAGKHVVVEKAFTLTSQDAEALVQLARQKRRLLSVFQNRRWDSDFLTVQQVIRSGVLGRLVEYEAHYDRFRNYIQAGTWKEDPTISAGIVYNLGAHSIDQALTLFGMPERVWAEIGVQRSGGQVDDHFEIVLFYPELKATLKTGYLVREPGPKYQLHGERGSFVKSGMDLQEDALIAGQVPGGPGWGLEPPAIWGKLNTEVNGLHIQGSVESLPGNYLAYYDGIFAAIREDKTPPVTAESARDVIRIIELAYQSHREQRVIPL